MIGGLPLHTSLAQFVALSRPLHLIGGWVFCGLGLALARVEGATLNLPLGLGGLLAVTAIQLMTHYSNDYFDLDADQANLTPTRWSGGSRVLPLGLLPPWVSLAATASTAMLALLTVLWLTLHSPVPLQTLLLFGLALALAWSYSAPPLSLNRRGLGELSGAFLIPGLTTLVSFQLQTGELTRLPLLAILPLCCFQFAHLLAVNFPDALGDAAVGKVTLVVRLGGRWAAWLYVAALLLAYGMLPLLVVAGLPLLVALLLFAAAPLASWLLWQMQCGSWRNPARWESLGFWSIGLLMGSALLELLGFVFIAT